MERVLTCNFDMIFREYCKYTMKVWPSGNDSIYWLPISENWNAHNVRQKFHTKVLGILSRMRCKNRTLLTTMFSYLA